MSARDVRYGRRGGRWAADTDTIDRGDKNAERKCTDCGHTHRAYRDAGRPGSGALGCIVDPCDDCGGRHVGPLPPLTPCAHCGAGRHYPAHHACLGTWAQTTREAAVA